MNVKFFFKYKYIFFVNSFKEEKGKSYVRFWKESKDSNKEGGK